MTQGQARDKGAHEAKVLEDVLSLCLLTGGPRAKAARKLVGDADSSTESPDIRVGITRRDAIVGIEHFQVDRNIKGGRKAESKDSETWGLMNKQCLELLKMDEGPDRDAKMLDAVGGFAADLMQHSLDAEPGDLARSLEARLYGAHSGHIGKLGAYRRNLSSTGAGKAEIGFLIEIRSDYSEFFMNDERGIRKMQNGQGILSPEAFGLLERASKDVEWLLLGFYPSVGGAIADARIVDCRSGRFAASCKRQKLAGVELLDIEDGRKRRIEYDCCAFQEDSDLAQLMLYRNDDPIELSNLARECVSKTAKALNLARLQKPFATTSPIQALYETVRMAAKKHRGEFTPTIVLRLLQEIPPGEAYRRYADFGKRHGISAKDNSPIC